MNATEAIALCRYVAACCPSQKFDEYTPDAWHDLLDDMPFLVAKVAAREVAKTKPYVAPCDIRKAVYSMRRQIKGGDVANDRVLAELPEPEFRGFWGADSREEAVENARQHSVWRKRFNERLTEVADEMIVDREYRPSRLELES